MSERASRRALLALLAAGALLRAWWQVWIATDPSWWFPHGNTGGFLRIARLIVSGDLLAGDAPFFYGPLYSYFLAACFSLPGLDGSFAAPRILQALLGLATALLVFRITRRAFDRGAALAAAALMAFHGPGLFFEGLLVATTLSTFLLVLGVDLLSGALDEEGAVRPGGRALLLLALSGAAFGLCAWGRGNVLLLLPPAALWILWRTPVAAPRAWRRLLPAAAFALGACALILPVTARNALVGGDRVLLVSQGGLNFFAGNNPESPGWFQPPEGAGLVDDNDRAWEANSRRVAEAAEGRPLKPSEVSAHWFRRAASWMAEEPGAAARLLLLKARLLVDPYEIPIHRNAQVFLDGFPLGFALPGFGAVLGLAAAGLLLGGVGRDRRGLLLLLAAVYAATVVAFFVVDRYRFPLVPLLAPFAGLALARLAAAARALARGERPEVRRRLAAAALLALGLPLALHAPGVSAVSPDVRGRYEALEYHRRGKAWERLGRPDEALAAYERALEASPGHVASRLRQCRLLLDAGRAGEAEEILRTLLSVAPELEEARRLLEEAEAAASRP